jgi:hypothetical protein
MMDQLSNAREITQSSQSEDGLEQTSWASGRYRLESKECAICGKTFGPRTKMENGKQKAAVGEKKWGRQATCSISCSQKYQPHGEWALTGHLGNCKNCVNCGAEFRPRTKIIRGQVMTATPKTSWEKQKFCTRSCAMKVENPMSNHQIKKKMIAKLREIKHKPIKRGGNGQLLPLPQLALLHALGEGWESEVAVATKLRSTGLGYPTCYKIDIAHKEKKIGIEIDGVSHGTLERQAADLKKTEFLVSQGWSIYRLSNKRALHLYSTFTSVDTLLTSLMGG